jgi:galactonate dehydratase
MKITSYELFMVPPRWLFLKIETDEGITGWGEPVIEGRAATVKTAVDELMEYLIGKDPMNIEDHWNVMYRCGFYRGGPILMSAIAGIDQALWDIKGKYFKAPVYQLLGGKARDLMRVYSWIGGDRPSEVGKAAKDIAEKGFTAVKMNATAELQYVDTYEKIDEAIKRIAAVRDAVGPNVVSELIFMEGYISQWRKYWQKNWKYIIQCLLKNQCLQRTTNRCAKLLTMYPYLLPQGKECSRGGTLNNC